MGEKFGNDETFGKLNILLFFASLLCIRRSARFPGDGRSAELYPFLLSFNPSMYSYIIECAIKQNLV